MTQEDKDFLISYNKIDHEWAEWIAYKLEEEGYSCIFQPWDFLPGSNAVLELHNAVKRTKRTLAVLTPDYLDTIDTHPEWTVAFAQDPTGEGGKLIPIRVRECKLSGLFTSITPLDLMNIIEKSASDTLLAGVRGTRLKPSQAPIFPSPVPNFPGPSNVLIASLGDSPAVVTAMYDRLTKREPLLTIDRVKILCPGGDDVQTAYEFVEKFFPDKQKLRYELLPFNDADNWLHACMFLQKLCNMLDQYQEKGDIVYLSLAGGRKSMAALMAWVVPYFSCIKGLYHVVSTEKEYFPSVHDIVDMSVAERSREMHPNLDQLSLVEIPFEGEQEMSAKLLLQLLSSPLKKYEEAEAIITGQTIFQKENILKVEVTQQVIAQFRKLCKENLEKENLEDVWQVHNGLLEMHQVATLRRHEAGADAYPYPDKAAKSRRVSLHYFTGLPLSIRPVFYTLPTDIYANPATTIKQVVICSLEVPGTNGEYRTLREIATSADFSVLPSNVLPPVPSPTASILIVPLGRSPMIATQLYTLLTEQERHTIHKVILIYPKLAVEVDNGADLIKEALYKEYSVSCIPVGIPGLDDIASEDDCRKYQACLEAEIERVRQEYPNHKIDLALSGGRKGMTAMTIFAAQKHHIPYVYHTLITNEEISERIDDETNFEALNDTGLSEEERHQRLFLHAYQSEPPNKYANFTLFRVPVFSPDGW